MFLVISLPVRVSESIELDESALVIILSFPLLLIPLFILAPSLIIGIIILLYSP